MTSVDKPINPLKVALHVLNERVRVHRDRWSSLENALAHVLHEVMHGDESSRTAYAVYFSPDGFHGRLAIVNNATTQWCEEQDAPELLKHWNEISKRLSKARNMRNLIAHGSVQLFEKNRKTYVRLLPPAFDVTRIPPSMISKGSIPGASLEEVDREIKHVILLQTAAVIFAGGVVAVKVNKAHAWREISLQLTEHLSEIDKLFPDAQKKKGC